MFLYCPLILVGQMTLSIINLMTPLLSDGVISMRKFFSESTGPYAPNVNSMLFESCENIRPANVLRCKEESVSGRRLNIQVLGKCNFSKGIGLIFDLFLVCLAGVLSYHTQKYLIPDHFVGLSTEPNYYVLLFVTLTIFTTCFQFFDVADDSWRQKRFDEILVNAIKVVGIGVILLIFFLFISQQQGISRTMLGVFAMFSILFLSLSKSIFSYVAVAQAKRDPFQKKVLLVGSKDRARDVANAMISDPNSEYKLLGCLETGNEQGNAEVFPGVRVIGLMKNFHTILLEKAVDEVIFAIPLKKVDKIRNHISFAEKLGVNVRIIPDWQIQGIMYHPETANVYLDTFMGLPTLALSSRPAKEMQLFLKTMLDYMGAALGMLVLSPLFLCIATCIRLTSQGPVLFTQERSGLNGRKFKMYKFRSMLQGAEGALSSLLEANEMDGPVFKMANDPRITPLGRFLRKTSLDELPQLINVLRGEMSLVGPRPPISSEVEQYKPWQRRRLSMKPGLTCIWQVGARNNIDFDQWMKLDLRYIDNWSLLLDLKLLLQTIPAVFWGSGM